MRNVIGWVGVMIIIAALVGGFIAYFVYKTDPATNVMYDGFGRPLSESPFLMRFFLGQDRLWAGWFWFVVDMVAFWGSISVGAGIAGWGFKEPNLPPLRSEKTSSGGWLGGFSDGREFRYGWAGVFESTRLSVERER